MNRQRPAVRLSSIRRRVAACATRPCKDDRTGDIAKCQERAALTFWIPERIDALLAERERHHGKSRSDMLRGILRRYLYGLCGSPEDTPPRTMPVAQVSRGQWGGRMPQLGKNIVEVKLWLPCRWRDDLAALAAESGITLSHFAREVLVTQLLGHAWLPARVVHGEADMAEQD